MNLLYLNQSFRSKSPLPQFSFEHSSHFRLINSRHLEMKHRLQFFCRHFLKAKRSVSFSGSASGCGDDSVKLIKNIESSKKVKLTSFIGKF